MTHTEWAKAELDLWREKQRGDKYGLMCIDCVEELIDVFKNQSHSGYSASIVANAFKRLVDGKPLMPITEEDEFDESIIDPSPRPSYPCKRMSSLFRKTDENGNVSYHDIGRAKFFDTSNNLTWHDGYVDRLVDEMFPIKLPYMPKDRPYIVYGYSKFLDKNGNDISEEHRGECNYTYYDYLITPEGEKIKLDKEVRE